MQNKQAVLAFIFFNGINLFRALASGYFLIDKNTDNFADDGVTDDNNNAMVMYNKEEDNCER